MTTGVLKFIGIGAIIVVAAVFGAWYFLSAPDEAPAMPGRLEGATTYPSDFTPEQIVCAEPAAGGTGVCTDVASGEEGLPATHWSLEVPAGDYFVYAMLKDPSELGGELGDFRAYYTQFVVCGMEYACTDHTKLPVTVRSGETTRDVRPYDWYAR